MAYEMNVFAGLFLMIVSLFPTMCRSSRPIVNLDCSSGSAQLLANDSDYVLDSFAPPIFDAWGAPTAPILPTRLCLVFSQRRGFPISNFTLTIRNSTFNYVAFDVVSDFSLHVEDSIITQCSAMSSLSRGNMSFVNTLVFFRYKQLLVNAENPLYLITGSSNTLWHTVTLAIHNCTFDSWVAGYAFGGLIRGSQATRFNSSVTNLRFRFLWDNISNPEDLPRELRYPTQVVFFLVEGTNNCTFVFRNIVLDTIQVGTGISLFQATPTTFPLDPVDAKQLSTASYLTIHDVSLLRGLLQGPRQGNANNKTSLILVDRNAGLVDTASANFVSIDIQRVLVNLTFVPQPVSNLVQNSTNDEIYCFLIHFRKPVRVALLNIQNAFLNCTVPENASLPMGLVQNIRFVMVGVENYNRTTDQSAGLPLAFRLNSVQLFSWTLASLCPYNRTVNAADAFKIYNSAANTASHVTVMIHLINSGDVDISMSTSAMQVMFANLSSTIECFSGAPKASPIYLFFETQSALMGSSWTQRVAFVNAESNAGGFDILNVIRNPFIVTLLTTVIGSAVNPDDLVLISPFNSTVAIYGCSLQSKVVDDRMITTTSHTYFPRGVPLLTRNGTTSTFVDVTSGAVVFGSDLANISVSLECAFVNGLPLLVLEHANVIGSFEFRNNGPVDDPSICPFSSSTATPTTTFRSFDSLQSLALLAISIVGPQGVSLTGPWLWNSVRLRQTPYVVAFIGSNATLSPLSLTSTQPTAVISVAGVPSMTLKSLSAVAVFLTCGPISGVEFLFDNLVWSSASLTTSKDDTVTPPTTVVDGAVVGIVASSSSSLSSLFTGSELQVRCGMRNGANLSRTDVAQPRSAASSFKSVMFLAPCAEARPRTTKTLTFPQQIPIVLHTSPPPALVSAGRGLTAVVTVTYAIPRAAGSGSLPFLQVSLRALTLARLCDTNSGGDDDDLFLSGPMDNPFQMHLGGSGIPPTATFVAGSVIGNALFCMACSVVGVGMVTLARHREKQQLSARKHVDRDAFQLESNRTPSLVKTFRETLPHVAPSLAFPFGALSQPLATASLALFVMAGVNENNSGGTVGVVILALLGLLICIVLPLHWVAVVHFNWFSSTNSGVRPLPTEGKPSSSPSLIKPPVRFVNHIESGAFRTQQPTRGSKQWRQMSLRERMLLTLHSVMLFPHASNGWELQPRHVSSSAQDRYRRPIAVEAYLPLMEAYRPSRQWYFVVDASYSVVCGAVFGVAWAVNANFDSSSSAVPQSNSQPSPSSSGNGCEWVVWVTFALTLLMICVLGILRPFLAYYEFGFALLMAALTTAALALQLAGNETAADDIVVVQLALGLLVPAIQLLRLLLLWSFLLARKTTKAAAGLIEAIISVNVGRLGGLFDVSTHFLSMKRRTKVSDQLTLANSNDDAMELFHSVVFGGPYHPHYLSQDQRLERLIALICSQRIGIVTTKRERRVKKPFQQVKGV